MIHIEPMDIEERSSKMMLHYMQRKHYIMIFVGFVALYFTMLMIGGLGPQVHITEPADQLSSISLCYGNQNKSSSCQDITNTTVQGVRWSGLLDHMEKLNRFFETKMTLYPDFSIYNQLIANQTKNPTDNSTTPQPITSITLNLPTFIVVRASKFSDATIVDQYNYTFQINCNVNSTSCSPTLIVNEIGIFYPTYVVDLVILPISSSDPSYSILNGQLKFEFYYMNSSYSLLEMMTRLVFACATLITLIGFGFSLRKYNWRTWTPEQQFIIILLTSLFLYDNPIYLLTLLVAGVGAYTIDNLFVALYVSVLFFFWFVLFDGIRKNGHEFKFKSFYAPKLALVLVFLLSSIIGFSIYEYHQKYSPLSNLITSSVVIFSAIASITIVIFLFYLLYLVARGWVSTKTLPYINIKLKLHLLFSIFVLIAFAIGLLFSWADTNRQSAIEFTSFFGLFNLYTYILAIIYLPHPNSELLYQSSRLGDGADHMKLTSKEEEEFNEVYL